MTSEDELSYLRGKVAELERLSAVALSLVAELSAGRLSKAPEVHAGIASSSMFHAPTMDGQATPPGQQVHAGRASALREILVGMSEALEGG